MGSFITKEDDVAKISTSVFITNFPESCSANELFQSCKQYDHVVDTFIPTKRSKNGRRFGFVRFINVFNEERLVNNLCTVWIDHFKLHANIARFHRPPLKEKNVIPKKDGGGQNKFGIRESEVPSALVLNDEYLLSKDLSKSLLGKVKQFVSIANLRKAVSNEGFVDIKIQYMVELWVLLEFGSEDSMKLFQDNDSCQRNPGLGFLTSWRNNDEEPSDVGLMGDWSVCGGKSKSINFVNLSDHKAEEANKDGHGIVVNKNSKEVYQVWLCYGHFKSSGVASDKQMLWDYLTYEIDKWKGEVVIMGDFNEGFNKVVEDAWREGPCDKTNAMLNMMMKLKFLKAEIQEWNKSNMLSVKNVKAKYKEELEALEAIIDRGDGNEEIVNKRTEVVNNIQKFDKIHSSEMAQKAKIIENDVYDAVKYFFTYGNIPKGCNSSFIALIPKIPDANMVKDFRPISLIGSLYKIIAKILVNRLVAVLGDIVNEGHDINSNKASWVNWKKVLASKEKGGLGVSSLFALNRGLMFKWIWRFYTQNTLLWVRVVKAIHGDDGNVGGHVKSGAKSCWLDIVRETHALKTKGINLLDCMHVKLGNGDKTVFWEDIWIDGKTLKNRFPRIYSLESCKLITVGAKLAQPSLEYSFRRNPRGGVEQDQFNELSALVHDVSLIPMSDRWKWDLESSGDFSVASVRKIIDDKSLSDVDSKTRWIKYVPIKVNVHAWKVKTDSLSTRFNVSRRCIDIDSIMCAICDNGVETSRHLFFYCCMVRQIVRKITRWWDVPYVEVESYEDWYNWLVNLQISSMHKQMRYFLMM
ncbi:RNA-directed DNA polymerase, eukaryota, reverse transcriptase zinc-binding domain protein [Tanacetum coccineum]|uniref:RNA-directed DNA polymerase, eukaryota, reverse transcriptase zinc-binding domain protein n=1 Tax=Tanacetum coccineum TaxID=301880 RepID=A0ABQ5BCW8_9ASTR